MSHGGYSKRYTSHLAVFVRQWLYPVLSPAVCCPNGVAVFTGVEPWGGGDRQTPPVPTLQVLIGQFRRMVCFVGRSGKTFASMRKRKIDGGKVPIDDEHSFSL